MPYYENDDFELKYWEQHSPFVIVKDAGNYNVNWTAENFCFSAL